MKKYSSLLVFVATVSFSGLAFAGSESGFSLGGSVGSAKIDYSERTEAIEFDDSDSAYKVFAGYNLGMVPFLNLAIEGSYMDLGSQEGEILNTSGNKIETDGWAAYGLGGFDLGPVGLFAKVGYFAWDSDFKTILGDESNSGTDPAFGLGAKFQLGSFAVRAEYEMFDLDGVDIDFASVGASYTF